MKSITNLGWTLGLGLALALAIGMSTRAKASTTATIDASLVTSNHPGNDLDIPDNLRNSSGLSGTVGVGDDALKTHDAAQSDMWIAQNTASLEALTFTLPTTSDLLGAYIWNESENGGRDVQNFTIDTSTDGGATFTPYGTTFTLVESVGPPEHAQFVPFTVSGVNEVHFDIVSDFGDTTYVGLDEVRFQAEVPEPASFGLLAAGGAILLGRRRQGSR